MSVKRYATVEEAYSDMFSSLKSVARRHLYNPDLCVDVVHDAFARTLVYLDKNKDKVPQPRISSYILIRNVLICCRRSNKYSVELPSGDTRLYGQEYREWFDEV